jgi:hypothetical protein
MCIHILLRYPFQICLKSKFPKKKGYKMLIPLADKLKYVLKWFK